jgi:hypothetical protein
MRSLPTPSPALVIAVVALAAAVGGFAVAAVPDRSGRITVCYAKKGGDLRVLAKGNKCRRAEKRLRFNQTGPAGLPGSSASSMLTGNTGNIPGFPGETRWLHPSGVSDWWGAPTFADMLSPNTPVVAQDLAVRLPNPAGAGESYTITLQLDGADTTLGCAVAGDVELTCGNSDARVAIAPRSMISFKVVMTGGAVARRVLFSWRATEGS